MVRIESATCNGCKTCVDICPHGVLAMKDKRAFVLKEDDCIECGACMINCSTGSAQVVKGTGCLVVIIKEDILRLRGKEACGTACCG